MEKKYATARDNEIQQSYFERIKLIPLLSFEEELELSKRVQRGDKTARNRLIEANLRLVVKIARVYLTADVPYMDLIQEGNIGLMRAAEKYDHGKKVRFSTYANWWIRQAIVRYLSNKRRVIRLPHRKEEILRKVQRAYHTLSQTLTRQPTIAEIAEHINCSYEEVAYILSMTNGLVSLDMESGDGESVSLGELHEDYTYSPDQALMRKSLHDYALHCIDRLKDREKRILMYRYQLNGGERHTLKTISDKMGISPETVRQIEIRALKKIREHAGDTWRAMTPEAI
ncbi:MAG: RNA polymerase sigma factor RpoD/SigA [Treponema sp.]|nr:RNA polymerase sigma factor RpoD/SigA [Treponema sp.]